MFGFEKILFTWELNIFVVVLNIFVVGGPKRDVIESFCYDWLSACLDVSNNPPVLLKDYGLLKRDIGGLPNNDCRLFGTDADFVFYYDYENMSQISSKIL